MAIALRRVGEDVAFAVAAETAGVDRFRDPEYFSTRQPFLCPKKGANFSTNRESTV